MTDIFDKAKRSDIMSRVRSKDTKPEMLVRRVLHGMGYRYRLHVRELPGTPDIVLPRHQKVVMVNSCLFHGHDCVRAKRPRTNAEWWAAKIDRTIERDAENLHDLQCRGWDVLVVWQCQTRRHEGLVQLLSEFMAAPLRRPGGECDVQSGKGEDS